MTEEPKLPPGELTGEQKRRRHDEFSADIRDAISCRELTGTQVNAITSKVLGRVHAFYLRILGHEQELSDQRLNTITAERDALRAQLEALTGDKAVEAAAKEHWRKAKAVYSVVGMQAALAAARDASKADAKCADDLRIRAKETKDG